MEKMNKTVKEVQKTNSEVTVGGSSLLVIALNINGLNSPI